MKILTLQIKKQYLDQIIAGTKPEEEREITPKTAKRYLKYINEGKENESFEIVHYDALQLINGYAANRPEILIEVKSSRIEVGIDENGEDIVFTENGEEYVLASILYNLGNILKRKNI